MVRTRGVPVETTDFVTTEASGHPTFPFDSCRGKTEGAETRAMEGHMYVINYPRKVTFHVIN